MIDDMVALLRKEEAEDIAHRDRCQSAQNKNGNDKADLTKDIEDAQAMVTKHDDAANTLTAEIQSVDGQIGETKSTLETMLQDRNNERSAFERALKVDTEAVATIENAIVALSKYYKRNKIPLELVQHKQEPGPEYTVDQDKAPETTFSSSGSRKSEGGGIIAILEMIKEDTENEIKQSRKDDADAQATYVKNRDAARETLATQEATKVQKEQELASAQEAKSDAEELKTSKEMDLSEENNLENTLANDCAWVESHFDKRRTARKDEISGLQEAKNFLAGVQAGDSDDLEG